MGATDFPGRGPRGFGQAELDYVAGTFLNDTNTREARPPHATLVIGPAGSGKTRWRREQYAQTHVLLDAGDVFLRLAQGGAYDFPSILEPAVEWVGAHLARRAIAGHWNIAIELAGSIDRALVELSTALQSVGYRVELVGAQHDPVSRAESTPPAVPAAACEAWHLRWLHSAITTHRAPPPAVSIDPRYSTSAFRRGAVMADIA